MKQSNVLQFTVLILILFVVTINTPRLFAENNEKDIKPCSFTIELPDFDYTEQFEGISAFIKFKHENDFAFYHEPLISAEDLMKIAKVCNCTVAMDEKNNTIRINEKEYPLVDGFKHETTESTVQMHQYQGKIYISASSISEKMGFRNCTVSEDTITLEK